ncbi:hypothetical protein DUI87_14587 [Hirundo rustica rustica]|uniref:Uncharacterized protein n=1 Tax=Hirundo rustica rustica TaxID=333673 RepID=A0A3M0K561_HIRRU|nr:hypothetical protein DUI87_14587 [Hirundo rustica rustica]
MYSEGREKGKGKGEKEWNGMEWNGMEWNGMERNGTVSSNLVGRDEGGGTLSKREQENHEGSWGELITAVRGLALSLSGFRLELEDILMVV